MEQNFLNITQSILDLPKGFCRDVKLWMEFLDTSLKEDRLHRLINKACKQAEHIESTIQKQRSYQKDDSSTLGLPPEDQPIQNPNETAVLYASLKARTQSLQLE